MEKISLPMTEDATPQPEDPYGIAKYAVELDLKEAHDNVRAELCDFSVRTMFMANFKTSATVTAMSSHFHETKSCKASPDNFRRRQTNARGSANYDVAPVIAPRALRAKKSYNQIFTSARTSLNSVKELQLVVLKRWGRTAN